MDVIHNFRKLTHQSQASFYVGHRQTVQTQIRSHWPIDKRAKIHLALMGKNLRTTYC